VSVLAKVAVVKESGEFKDECVEIQGFKVPFFCLGNTNTIVDRGECGVVGPKTDDLSQAHLEGNVRENKGPKAVWQGKQGDVIGQPWTCQTCVAGNFNP
jgi:hypothetical protein